jgi:hypothetical protein
MAHRNDQTPLNPLATGSARVEGENATYTRAADNFFSRGVR